MNQESLAIIERYDSLAEEMEQGAIDRLNSQLDTAYDNFEAKFLRQYDGVAQQENLLANQRRAILMDDLRQVLQQVDPSRRDEYESRFQNVIQRSYEQGAEYADAVTQAIAPGSPMRSVANLNIEAAALQARDAADRLYRYNNDFRDRASAIIEQGLIQGWSGRRTNEAFQDANLPNLTRNAMERIVRTERSAAFNTAAQRRYAQNDIDGVQWITTKGDVCPLCVARNGQVYPVGRVQVPGHPFCLTPGTVVSAPTVLAGTERQYSGEVVTIKTAGGHELTVTPNHPILTRDGWEPAGLVTKGSHLFTTSNGEMVTMAIAPDQYNRATPVEDVLSSLRASGGIVSIPHRVAPEDFHGDGAGSDSAVVTTRVGDGLPDSSRLPEVDTSEAVRVVKMFPDVIVCDRVIEVSRRWFQGMVYNLETSKGWYFANGILTHNCRCMLLPWMPEWADDDLTDQAFLDDYRSDRLADLRSNGQEPNYGPMPFERAARMTSPPNTLWRPGEPVVVPQRERIPFVLDAPEPEPEPEVVPEGSQPGITPAPLATEQFVLDRLHTELLDDRRADFVERFGLERVERVEREYARLLQNADIQIKLSAGGLRGIIESGRFLGTLERSEMGADNTKTDFYNETRTYAEQRMFGESYDQLPSSERPIYGYYADQGSNPDTIDITGGLDSYGDMAVRLRSDVNSRSTVTANDSFANIVPSSPYAINAAALFDPYTVSDRLFESTLQALESSSNLADFMMVHPSFSPYIEAQVHGQVQSGDIAEIFILQGTKLDQEIEEWAEANGVAITVYEKDESTIRDRETDDDDELDDFFAGPIMSASVRGGVDDSSVRTAESVRAELARAERDFDRRLASDPMGDWRLEAGQRLIQLENELSALENPEPATATESGGHIVLIDRGRELIGDRFEERISDPARLAALQAEIAAAERDFDAIWDVDPVGSWSSPEGQRVLQLQGELNQLQSGGSTVAVMEELRNEIMNRIPREEAEALAGSVRVLKSATRYESEENIRNNLADFYQLTGGRGVPNRIAYDEERAYAIAETSRLNIGREDNPSEYRATFFHELGHFVEFESESARAAAESFIRARATSDEMLSMNDLVPEMGGTYGDDEFAYPGSFIHPYVGVVYENGATEVISMGLERFSSPERMLQFYKQDQEHFALILGIILGD